MNLSTFPRFCSPICQRWPFLLPVNNAAINYCFFDKDYFDDSYFEQSQIELPKRLQSAVNKRKAEYLAGRLCAREALKIFNYDGYPSSQQDKSPLWPSALCGSISHSQGIAAAVVAERKHWHNLGLDIERLIKEQRSEKLLSSVTNSHEQKLLKDDISLFATLAFSVKESLFKALYPLTHKHFYFEHAEIIDWSEQGTVSLKLLIDLSDQWQKEQQFFGQFFIENNYLWSLIAIPKHL